MKLTAQIRYAAAPDRVFPMLLDRGFQEQVCEATGALRHEVTVAEIADGGATIRASRDLPTDEFPDFAKKFVGDTLTVVRTDVWGAAADDGSRTGSIVVEIAGAPVRLTGTLAMRPEGPDGPDGAATVEDIDGDLKASVPLMGGKVEKAVEPSIRAAIAKEEQVSRRWLAG